MPQARTTIKVIVQTRAPRNEFLGHRGDFLQVKVTAAPEGGKANDALVQLIATALKVPRSSIRIIRGHASREKVIAISNISPDDLRSRLSGEPPE